MCCTKRCVASCHRLPNTRAISRARRSLPARDRRQHDIVVSVATIVGRRSGRTILDTRLTIPLVLMLIHLLCCTLARLTIRVGGAIAVALALPKKDTQNSDISAPPSSSHKRAKGSLFYSLFSGVPSLSCYVQPPQLHVSVQLFVCFPCDKKRSNNLIDNNLI